MLANSDLLTPLPASDMARAKRFYKEALGLEPVAEDPGGAHYRSGSSWFDLYASPYAGVAKHTLAAWIVENIEEAMQQLRSRGVEFEEIDLPSLKTVNGVAEFEHERAAWFKDSEGNILAISQLTKDFRT